MAAATPKSALQCFLLKPGAIEIREVKPPSPRKGELLVRVRAALTCGTDLKAFLRGHPVIPMPGPFGHEFSGTLAAVGAGVRGFKEGDHVMAVHSAPCLKCVYCRKGVYNLCEHIMETKVLGAFAEYILLPAHIASRNVFHKPDNLGFEEAALLEPVSCVVHGMNGTGFKFDGKGVRDAALVIGAGPIGLLHLLLLKGRGAVVSVMDVNAGRLGLAKTLGADDVFKPETFDSGEGRDFGAGGRAPYDAVFECTGRPEVWENSVNYLRRGGTVTLFGGCPSGTRVTYDAGRLHYDEITLRGVFHYTPEDVKRAFDILSKRDLPFAELISGRYPLSETGVAFERLSRGEGIKYAIIP